MKRLIAVMLLLCLVFTSCSEEERCFDTYEYDGYMYAQWGMTPEETASALGLDRKYLSKLSELEEDLPEGTIAYDINRYYYLYGATVVTRLYFAESVPNYDGYVGLYAIRFIFQEGEFDSSSKAVFDEIDSEAAIEDLSYYALYNTIEEHRDLSANEGENQSLYLRYCKNTPNDIKGEVGDTLRQSLQDVPEPFYGTILEGDLTCQPLSSVRLYYNGDTEQSVLLYEGYTAAFLRNQVE